MSQQASYGQPYCGMPPASRSSGGGVPWLFSLIAFLLAALLAITIIQITPARPSRLSPSTRNTVQAADDTSDKTLATIESEFTKSVFNTSTTDTAPKQQVAEMEYLFEMQVLIAQQNKAVLKSLLDS